MKAKAKAKTKEGDGPVKDSTLNVRIDRRTRERFHAACQVLGTTIEKRIHGYMLETIECAKIPESN